MIHLYTIQTGRRGAFIELAMSALGRPDPITLTSCSYPAADLRFKVEAGRAKAYWTALGAMTSNEVPAATLRHAVGCVMDDLRRRFEQAVHQLSRMWKECEQLRWAQHELTSKMVAEMAGVSEATLASWCPMVPEPGIVRLPHDLSWILVEQYISAMERAGFELRRFKATGAWTPHPFPSAK